MTSALFTAFALIATGQVEPASLENNLAPKLRSEASAEDPLLRVERLLRLEERERR